MELGAGEVSWFRLGVGESFIRFAADGAPAALLRSSGNVERPSVGREGDLSGEIAGTAVVVVVG